MIGTEASNSYVPAFSPPYAASASRYAEMAYRRVGRSGVKLPSVSLGLWQNFGDTTAFSTQQQILRKAFDLGITHLDLANNYGPPYGSTEENFGRHFDKDFRSHRDELFIATKAGYDMHPGPYGEWGSRKHVLGSLDASLARMGLDYVDVFYSHRADPETPLEETMGALHSAVVSGRARYVGISSYSASRSRAAHKLLADMGTPLLIHQPSYSLFNRWVEKELLDVLYTLGVGVIAFSPLAQGLLTKRYLNGIPTGSRASQSASSLAISKLGRDIFERVRCLNEIAEGRGQSLAQLSLSWVLRDPRISSVLVGASSVEQLEENVRTVSQPPLTVDELAIIEGLAVDSGINLWAESSGVE
jgi:L-glyceraldehyde 3-phosphate reductase